MLRHVFSTSCVLILLFIFDLNYAIGSKPSSKVTSSLTERQLLSDVSKAQLSIRDYEELYGNSAKFGIVTSFASTLISKTIEHIGQNELRRQFHLKTQQINFANKCKEEPYDPSQTFSQRVLNYFAETMYKQNKDCNLDDKFRPEDIDAAERFIDRKFPKVRQLFQTKYEEAADCCPKRFTKSSIDKLTSVYLDICGLLNIATSDLVDRTKNNLKRREPKECQLVKVDSVHLFT